MIRSSIVRRHSGGVRTALRALALAGVGMLVTAGCITGSTIRTVETGTAASPKLNPFIHYEQGETLFLGVDGRAAQYARGSLVPIGFGVANLSREPVTLHRESFVLEADDGSRFPLASYEEFRRGYTNSRNDQRFADEFIGILAQRYVNFTARRWRLFPFSGENAPANDELQLGRRHWSHTYLYFPMPDGGIKDREFTLLVTPRGGPETMIVRFRLR